MFATLLIVFREVTEAGLIVGIVLAATKGVPQHPIVKESLLDAAQRWAVLAAELETIHSLLEPLEEFKKKAG